MDDLAFQPDKSIPGRVRLLWPPAVDPLRNTTLSFIAGEFAEHVRTIWQPDRIHEYLLATDGRRHVWHSWLSGQDASSELARAYDFLTGSKSSDILADVHGCCPPGLVSALAKLGARARRPESYKALCSILKRGGLLARYVHHHRAMSDEEILAVAAVHSNVPPDPILKILLKRSRPHEFAELCWMIGRLALHICDRVIEREIISGGKPATTVHKLIGQLPFPLPPFSGDARLRPLCSANQLWQAGKDHQNCLADRSVWLEAVVEVQAGRTYFYEWIGRPGAVLSFGCFGAIGWILTQIEFKTCHDLDETSNLTIYQALRQIPEVGPTTMRYRYRH